MAFQVKSLRLRLNHWEHKSELILMKKHPEGKCHGGQTETEKHVLLQCAIYSMQRKKCRHD